MNENEYHEEDIVNIIDAKKCLERLPIFLQNAEYKNIHTKMSEYLLKHCTHIIEHDSVDINPDKSIHIKYCIKCFHTFTD